MKTVSNISLEYDEIYKVDYDPNNKLNDKNTTR